MSTHNIDFYKVFRKMLFQLSSNTHLMSSSCTIAASVQSGPNQLIGGEKVHKAVFLQDGDLEN